MIVRLCLKTVSVEHREYLRAMYLSGKVSAEDKKKLTSSSLAMPEKVTRSAKNILPEFFTGQDALDQIVSSRTFTPVDMLSIKKFATTIEGSMAAMVPAPDKEKPMPQRKQPQFSDGKLQGELRGWPQREEEGSGRAS